MAKARARQTDKRVSMDDATDISAHRKATAALRKQKPARPAEDAQGIQGRQGRDSGHTPKDSRHARSRGVQAGVE